MIIKQKKSFEITQTHLPRDNLGADPMRNHIVGSFDAHFNVLWTLTNMSHKLYSVYVWNKQNSIPMVKFHIRSHGKQSCAYPMSLMQYLLMTHFRIHTGKSTELPTCTHRASDSHSKYFSHVMSHIHFSHSEKQIQN